MEGDILLGKDTQDEFRWQTAEDAMQLRLKFGVEGKLRVSRM
ncbi:unnamed protein product [Anisakis simplex]|uniref:Nudix hydrolase domain-containing protein n=1 Tax=Anisakis simplex TaxID=6269 RepID=A0A0M3JED7_ANISI|nr:unnamed protein product [Anisakis simplex]